MRTETGRGHERGDDLYHYILKAVHMKHELPSHDKNKKIKVKI